MKLLKIGSSPACDIVLNDPHVSALHAEITVLDNGDIVLEDKNSSNGTFVGTQKLDPNVEVTVRRGDFVKIANVPLPWNRVPNAPSLQQYKQVVNIGSNFRNEIVVGSPAVSRYHASLRIDKSGKAFIYDNNSANGTQVNGVKIQSGKDFRVKPGDNIMVAGEDISEQVMPYMPKSSAKTIGIVAAVVAALAVIGAAAYYLLGSVGGAPARFQPSVVYIHSAYHYEVKVGSYTLRYPTEDYIYSSATGFFVDREGRIGTCRHVAVPWDEAYSKDKRESIIEDVLENMHRMLKVNNVSTQTDYNILNSSELGQALIEESSNLAQLNAKLTSLLSGKIELEGKMDFFAVGYSGNNYESLDEFKRCTLIAESGDSEKDVAIIQLNNKVTPSEIKDIFDLSLVTDEVLKPMADELYTIGYPYGFLWNYEKGDKELKNSIRETKCSKIPSKHDFEFQATSQPGASGSPVYLKNGRLVGVLSSVFDPSEGPTKAAHAFFLKKLYEDNIRAIAK